MIHFLDDWDLYKDNLHQSKYVDSFRKIEKFVSTKYINKKRNGYYYLLGSTLFAGLYKDFSILLQKKISIIPRPYRDWYNIYIHNNKQWTKKYTWFNRIKN